MSPLLIYLADVSRAIEITGVFLLFFSIALFFLCLLAYLYSERAEDEKEVKSSSIYFIKRLTIIIAITAIVLIILPSKETIYEMAEPCQCEEYLY